LRDCLNTPCLPRPDQRPLRFRTPPALVPACTPRTRGGSLTEDRQSWELAAEANWEQNELRWRDDVSDTYGVSVLLYNRPARAICRVRVGQVLLSRTTGAADVLHAVHVHAAIGVQGSDSVRNRWKNRSNGAARVKS